jgi:hypothetical protein
MNVHYVCARCGEYDVLGTLNKKPEEWLSSIERANLSRKIRRAQKGPNPVVLVESEIGNWALKESSPNAAEQLELLAMWMSKSTQPGATISLPILELFAVIGAAIDQSQAYANLNWLLLQDRSKELV